MEPKRFWNDEALAFLAKTFNEQEDPQTFFNLVADELPERSRTSVLGELRVAEKNERQQAFLERLLLFAFPMKDPKNKTKYAGYISHDVLVSRIEHLSGLLRGAGWEDVDFTGKATRMFPRKIGLTAVEVEGRLWYHGERASEAIALALSGKDKTIEHLKPEPVVPPDASELAKLYFEQFKAGVITKDDLMALLPKPKA